MNSDGMLVLCPPELFECVKLVITDFVSGNCRTRM